MMKLVEALAVAITIASVLSIGGVESSMNPQQLQHLADAPWYQGPKFGRSVAQQYERVSAATAADPSFISWLNMSVTSVAADKLPRSVEGRELLGVRITAGAQSSKITRPTIVVLGGMHAREWASVEAAIGLVEALPRLARTNPQMRKLLTRVAVVVLPLINPDGYERSVTIDRYWRKNARAPSPVDLNRNFATAWSAGGASDGGIDSETYGGPHPFSEPESRFVRDVCMALESGGNTISFALALHSYGQNIQYPPGWRVNATSSTTGLMKDMLDLIAKNTLTRTMPTVYHQGDEWSFVAKTDAFRHVPSFNMTVHERTMLQQRVKRVLVAERSVAYEVAPAWALYAAAGDAIDWIHATFDAVPAATMEMRPADIDCCGFTLPSEAVNATVMDAVAFVGAVASIILAAADENNSAAAPVQRWWYTGNLALQSVETRLRFGNAGSVVDYLTLCPFDSDRYAAVTNGTIVPIGQVQDQQTQCHDSVTDDWRSYLGIRNANVSLIHALLLNQSIDRPPQCVLPNLNSAHLILDKNFAARRQQRLATTGVVLTDPVENFPVIDRCRPLYESNGSRVLNSSSGEQFRAECEWNAAALVDAAARSWALSGASWFSHFANEVRTTAVSVPIDVEVLCPVTKTAIDHCYGGAHRLLAFLGGFETEPSSSSNRLLIGLDRLTDAFVFRKVLEQNRNSTAMIWDVERLRADVLRGSPSVINGRLSVTLRIRLAVTTETHSLSLDALDLALSTLSATAELRTQCGLENWREFTFEAETDRSAFRVIRLAPSNAGAMPETVWIRGQRSKWQWLKHNLALLYTQFALSVVFVWVLLAARILLPRYCRLTFPFPHQR